MAFFNNVGKVLTETGQGAVRKTKDLTETVRLNGAISEEEEKINALYSQIGEALYANMERIEKKALISYINWKANGAEGSVEGEEEICRAVLEKQDYLTAVVEIRSRKEIIADYQEQIRILKGIGKCPNCGADVAAGAAFCSNCGSPVSDAQTEKESEQKEDVCPVCGAKPDADAVFCIQCGNKLR